MTSLLPGMHAGPKTPGCEHLARCPKVFKVAQAMTYLLDADFGSAAVARLWLMEAS